MHRKKEGVKEATINRELSCLRHMFTWAQRRDYVQKHPLLLMEKLPEPQWIGRQPTREVCDAVLERVDPRFQPIFVFIRETGARRSEALNLLHENIDRVRRMATVAKSKTGKVRYLALTDEAISAINAVPRMPGCPYVFYNPANGRPWADARWAWKKAREAAGHAWLRVRDLRIAYGTELAEAGLHLDLVAKVLGNTRAVAEKYYAKVSPESAPKTALKVLQGGRQARAASV